MTKLGLSVGMLAAVFCFSVGAQTVNVMTLDQAGAQTVLQAARESAQQRNAPSAIAVVDPAGDLLAFQRMDGVRPASAELAIEKARTAARLQRPKAEIEENINQGRTAFVTAGIAALRGGVPIRVNGKVVGAVGVAGLSKETDTEIANTAAGGPEPPKTARLGDGVTARRRDEFLGESRRCLQFIGSLEQGRSKRGKPTLPVNPSRRSGGCPWCELSARR
jgi:glc operon protein GlcG